MNRKELANVVNNNVKKYLEDNLPAYELYSVFPESQHEDDWYLWRVIGKRKNADKYGGGDYACWLWNESTKSLNCGHYNLCNIDEAFAICNGISYYEQRAIRYCEDHGVIEYHLDKKDNSKMIYYSSFPMEHATIKATVNLDTFAEEREYIKGYYIAYKSKIGGKYTANYCV